MSQLALYHGSVSIVEKPIYGKGKHYNDYGLGFYCTESLNLAKEWAVKENQDGYANKYALDLSGLRILDLSGKGFTTLHWIAVLVQNRIFNTANEVAKEGKQYLIDHFALPIEDYDVIKGYRADDCYFLYAANFLNNALTVQRLSAALRLGNLGEQIVLKSPKAFNQLRFLGYEIADSAIYFPLRQKRNQDARAEFLSSRNGPIEPDALYLTDIIRGGIKPDDPRLQ